jgi:hypothetical protein
MNFNDKLNKARSTNLGEISTTRLRSDIAINDALRRESIKALTTKLEDIYEVLGLDLEMLHRKIAASRRSEYGRVPALINILAATYSWPVKDSTRAKDIPELQEQILDELPGLDGDVLLDLKDSKGYHSFLDEAFAKVDGIEPDYEEYSYFLLTVADALQLPFVDSKITEELWLKNEAKALETIAKEQTMAAEALARHEELLAS